MYNCLSAWFNMASNFDADKKVPTGILNNLYGGNSSSFEMDTEFAVRKVYVGNISSRTTTRDLRACFSNFGEVKNAHFAKPKYRSELRQNYQYGFVTYLKPEDAATAISVGKSGNIFLHDRRLVVNEADQKHQPYVRPDGRIQWTPKKFLKLRSARVERPVKIDESKCVLHLLNDDCLRLIFALLPKKDLLKIERVCKRWQEISRSMWLATKVVTFSNLGLRHPLTTYIVTQVLERCGSNVVNVDLTFKPNLLNAGVLNIIAESCPNLNTINLGSVPLALPGLKAIAHKCQDLHHVNMEYCTGMKDRDMQSFFFLCKNLKTIILSRNNFLTGRCLEGVNKDTIESISLNDCSGLHSDLLNKHISSFSNLRTLNIDQCINLTNKDLNAILQALPQLTSLSMRQYYPNVSHLTFKTLSQLKELVALNVSQNNSINDEVLEAIAKGCKKLKSLDISGCSNHVDHTTVGDSGIAAIAKLPQLARLKMSYMAIVSDLALMAIAENASKLQHLECRGCPSFHDLGCSRVVTLCNELRLFDFSGCDEVTSDTVEAACAAVKLRTNNVPLKLVVGGTLVQKSDIENVTHNLLEVDWDDLCEAHLRPDFVDDHYFNSDSDDDDDFEDLYDVDFDVVGSPALFFGDDLGEYYGYLAFMEGQDLDNSFEFEDDSD